MTTKIEVPHDPIGITVNEFEELRDLTIRYRNDAKAIFSTNPEGKVWPTPRYGNTPPGGRKYIEDMPHILEQLRRSLTNRRMEGGRLFVDDDGAYWKKGAVGSTEKVRFTYWRWKGERPVHEEIIAP